MWHEILNWVSENQALIDQIGQASLVMLAITVIALPFAVKGLPVDYFVSEERKPAGRSRKHPALWALLSLLKNLVGLVLILAGIVMLVLPGQGTVTILIGLAISNFPGKYKIERRIACQPAVGQTLNKIRKLTGSPPLEFPAENKEI